MIITIERKNDGEETFLRIECEPKDPVFLLSVTRYEVAEWHSKNIEGATDEVAKSISEVCYMGPHEETGNNRVANGKLRQSATQTEAQALLECLAGIYSERMAVAKKYPKFRMQRVINR
jgi:hypothetical protein